MRACIVCLLLLLAAGCGTLRRSSTGAGDFTLTKEESDFAQALAHYAEGLILEQELGRSSAQAMEEFAKAAELDPAKHELHTAAALIALQRRLPDRAVAILEQSCKANPDSVQACLDLATLCQVIGKTDEAVQHYSRALKIDKTCTLAYISLARLHFGQNRDAEALDILRKAIKETKDLQTILAFCSNKGRDFIANAEISRSIPCFQLMVQHSPSLRPQFYNLLGELYQNLGYDEEAVRNLTLATQQTPPLPDSFVKLALLQAKSDPGKAIETLLRADRTIPDAPPVLFLLGCLYSTQNRFTDAVGIYDRVLPLLKDADREALPASFYLYYGGACERAGLFEKAESVFGKCLAQYPDDAAVLNYLAYMWAEKGVKLETAEQYVTKALEKEPDNGAYVDTLGWILFKQKKYQDALDKIRRASELVKDDPVVTDHLGDTFNALADHQNAIEQWTKSLLLDPSNQAVAAKLEGQGVNVKALVEKARQTPRPPDKGKP